MVRSILLVLVISLLPACRFFKAAKREDDKVFDFKKSGDVLPAEEEKPKEKEADKVKEAEPKTGEEKPLPSCVAWGKWSEAPKLLSQTGCFDAKDPKQPVSQLVAYQVALDFWSDGADKTRWVAVPSGEKITFNEEGHGQFPAGSVVIKQFVRQGKRLETRFLMNKTAGTWTGYSYEWNEAETDASLVSASGRVFESGPDSWTFPSSNDCVRCHSAAAGPVLGWEVLQLNRSLTDGSNQLEHLQKLGLLDLPKPLNEIPQLNANGTVEEKARAYLHVNCAICHRPGGSGVGAFDLRLTRTLAEMKICDIEAGIDDLGLTDGRLLKPGNPDLSVILQRMVRSDYSRMPPLASHRIDEAGVAVVRDWIKSLSSCSGP